MNCFSAALECAVCKKQWHSGRYFTTGHVRWPLLSQCACQDYGCTSKTASFYDRAVRFVQARSDGATTLLERTTKSDASRGGDAPAQVMRKILDEQLKVADQHRGG